MSDQARNTLAGWYQDPSNALQQRYWDGTAWGQDVAPMGPVRTRTPGDVNPHWVLAIIVTLLFFPIGALSLIFSFMSNNATSTELAVRYARYAKIAAVWILCVAVAFWVLAIVLIGVVAVGGHRDDDSIVGSAISQSSAMAIVDGAWYTAEADGQSGPLTLAEVQQSGLTEGASITSDGTSAVKVTFSGGGTVCVTLPQSTSSAGPAITSC